MPPDSFIVRHPRQDERGELAMLTVNSFRADPGGARQWADTVELENVLCLAEDRPVRQGGRAAAGGRIISSITINPYRCYVGGQLIGMGGIGGVMTALDRHGRGCASRLLVEGLKLMRRRGQAISILYPFSHVYYGRLGYALAAERLFYPELTQRDLPRYEEFRLVDRFLPGEAVAPLVGPHNRIMRKYNLCCERTPDRWQKFIAQQAERKAFIYLIRDGGRITGWFTAGNVEGERGHESQTLSVALADRRALRAMLGMLARLPSNVRKIQLRMPPDFDLWDELAEPPAGRRQPSLQARVVDVAAALRGRGYARGSAGRLIFRIIDPQARWNHGTWSARWFGGELASLEKSSARPQLVADIAHFTQVFCGYRRARDLADLGKARVNSPACLDLLDELFHDRPTYTQDWF